VDQEVLEVEHPHVAHEALDANGRAALGHHEIEEVVGRVKRALGLDCMIDSELIGYVTQRAFEVRRQLTGVCSGGATRDPVALGEQHGLFRIAKSEEGRGDSRDSGPHHDDICRGIREQRT
jgi:hypothetical protein